MTNPLTIEGITKFSLIEEAHKYAPLLAKHKLLIFPQLFPSDKERNDIMVSFSRENDWKVDYDIKNSVQFCYQEDHSLSLRNASRYGLTGDLDVITAWHLEHPHFKYPQCAGMWFMAHKSCAKSSGSTGFVDMSTLLGQLDKEYIAFLEKCEIVQMSFFSLEENDTFDIYGGIKYDADRPYLEVSRPTGSPTASYLRKPIVTHRTTGEKILRVSPKGHYLEDGFVGHDRLATFNGRRPNPIEDKIFNEISQWVFESVTRNHELQYWHYWGEGDTLVVDVSVMAHCVRGGFSEGQRLMKGIWAFPNVSDLPRSPEQPINF